MSTRTESIPLSTELPNAPDYRDFRVTAEWASALRGRELHFEYGEGSGRMALVDAGLTPVLTPPNATRPMLTAVTLTLEGGTVDVDGSTYSALIWGESAVEKFLFSYYASASADDASRFLGRLFNAWYGYPGRVVQVCALAFRFGPAFSTGTLSLDATVGLVCQPRGGTPTVMSLQEFEQTYPTGGPRGTSPAAVPGPAVRLQGWRVRGGAGDSIVMREVAEFVSGVRGRYVWLMLEADQLTPWLCPTEAPSPEPPTEGRVAFSGVSTPVRGDRPAPRAVTLTVNGSRRDVVKPGDDPTAVADSVFWTDGAVEKLLLPYYASVKGRLAPLFNLVMMAKWDGWLPPRCVRSACATDVLLTMLRRSLERLDGARAAQADVQSTVYGVIHMPRSEYISQNDYMAAAGSSAVLEHRTRLLTLDPEAGFVDHALFGEPAA
ncbi:MAG TPA: hypothetical protein VF006_09550 [Longimicrobium sp.]